MTPQDTDNRAERLRQAIRLKKAGARSRVADLPLRPADQPAQLGEMQRSLWLVHRLDPLSPAYNLSSAFRVQGPLDLARLARAFNEVVSRHRLLRSTFRAEGGSVLQVVHPPTPLTIERLRVEDGRALTTALDEARKPFDLEKGPLVRLRIIQEEFTEERFLLLVLHHILADERSLQLLWQEVTEAYGGGPSEVGPPPQYDDYVYRQEQGSRDPDGKDLEFWRRRLDPMPVSLRLPFERPAEASVTPRGRLLSRTVDLSVQRGIRRLAADTGATPFHVFALAFRLLLHRYTDGEALAFATPVSTRSDIATTGMIGYFLNPIVVVSQLKEALRVEQAVKDFSRDLREALSHASVSFQELAEELAPPRQRDQHPIFQTMFVYQETSPPPPLGEARLEPVALDLGASKFDLTLFATEGEGSLKVAVEYRADRFDEAWMYKLLGHFTTLLENLPTDFHRALAEVPMLSLRERSSLQEYAQGADPGPLEEGLLPEQIFEQTRRSPECLAIVCGGVRQSYGELGASALAIAEALSASGVGPGDRVGVFLDRSPMMIAGILGCHGAGAAYLPLDPTYPEARNRDLLEDAEVATVLTTMALRQSLPLGPWAVIEVDGLDPLEGSKEGAAALAGLSAESPAYLLYTSGSTGRPKGVVVTHANLKASTGARRQVYGAPPERFLLVPSLAFDSSVAGIFWTLAGAGTLVIPTDDEAKDPQQLARLVAEERVSCLLCVPSLYGGLLAAGSDLLQSLEIAIVAGESCPSRLVEEHFRLLPRGRLFNEYGPSEATVWATVHELKKEDGGRPVAIGRPIPGVRVEVLDNLGRLVPAGIPGNAWIAGPTVGQGYWRRPNLTEERFSAQEGPGMGQRRYRTGDRMAWTEDGRLLFLGREDEQIKLRGFRIEPGEVEAALLEHPEVEEAAVVVRSFGSGAAKASDSGADHLVAFLRSQGSASWASWRQDLAQLLPEPMIPSRLVELSELPRLPNGKIDRRRLRELPLDSEGQIGEGASGPGAGALEAEVPTTGQGSLLSLWQGLLGRSGMGLDDNFFELGGHSLLVVEMTLSIERDFEVSLSANDVFENPTVRELARRIEQSGGPETRPYQHLFPLQPRGRKSPFIVAVPHFFSEMFAARFRGERPVYGLRGVSLRPEGNLGRWRTLEDLGEELVEEIRRRFPEEGYIIAGYSFGASMAVEVVRVMEELGIPVQRLYLIAPMPVDFYRWGPFRWQLDKLQKPLEELSFREALGLWARGNNLLTRRPYARAKRWLIVQPWRRLLARVGKLRGLLGLPLTPGILHADVRVERFRLHSRYRPGRLQTPTVIFNAQEAETDAAATWRPFFKGPFTVHPTPDPHLGDVSAEAAREVILSHLRDLDEGAEG